MKVQINIPSEFDRKIESVPVGHLFTLKAKWPIYLKLHNTYIAIGERHAGDTFGDILYRTDLSNNTLTENTVVWISPDKFLIQGT